MLAKIVIYFLILFITGFILLSHLYTSLADNPHKNIILIIALTILFNLAIFIFCIITYLPLKILHGETGPQGNRGDKGTAGHNAGLATCGDLIVTASDHKFKSKNNELRLPHKPHIIT